jgi:hypothetical protein
VSLLLAELIARERQGGHVFAEGLSAHGGTSRGNRPQRFIRRERGDVDRA